MFEELGMNSIETFLSPEQKSKKIKEILYTRQLLKNIVNPVSITTRIKGNTNSISKLSAHTEETIDQVMTSIQKRVEDKGIFDWQYRDKTLSLVGVCLENFERHIPEGKLDSDKVDHIFLQINSTSDLTALITLQNKLTQKNITLDLIMSFAPEDYDDITFLDNFGSIQLKKFVLEKNLTTPIETTFLPLLNKVLAQNVERLVLYDSLHERTPKQITDVFKVINQSRSLRSLTLNEHQFHSLFPNSTEKKSEKVKNSLEKKVNAFSEALSKMRDLKELILEKRYGDTVDKTDLDHIIKIVGKMLKHTSSNVLIRTQKSDISIKWNPNTQDFDTETIKH